MYLLNHTMTMHVCHPRSHFRNGNARSGMRICSTELVQGQARELGVKEGAPNNYTAFPSLTKDEVEGSAAIFEVNRFLK